MTISPAAAPAEVDRALASPLLGLAQLAPQPHDRAEGDAKEDEGDNKEGPERADGVGRGRVRGGGAAGGLRLLPLLEGGGGGGGRLGSEIFGEG